MTNETTQEPTADEIIEAMAQHLAGGGDNVDFETKCEELESEVEELEEKIDELENQCDELQMKLDEFEEDSEPPQ